MTNLFFLVLRILFITIMTIGMMASLTEFRFGWRKLLAIMAGYSIWVIASSLVLLQLGGELLLIRLFFLTISVPSILITYWAASDTPSQAVFNYMTQILLSLLVVSIIRHLTERFGLSLLVNVLLMMVFYGTIIYLEWHFLRRPFRMLIKFIPTNWSTLTFIPCTFCGYFIFLASWPVNYLENKLQSIYAYAAVIPLIVVYISVFKCLISQYHFQMERQNAALLTMQISALKEKLQKVKEVENSIQIQYHNLRHQLQTVTELVSRGDKEAALAFLNATQTRLDARKTIRWCSPPILDAVFSSYFSQAQDYGIQVEAKISLPATLPVDEGALAIVLANALENAIHANLELPQEQRQICCKMLGTPSVMLEISNPYVGAIVFDSDGLPTSQREGHGLGVQSISAFCSENGAVCQFDLMEGWFRLRLVL